MSIKTLKKPFPLTPNLISRPVIWRPYSGKENIQRLAGKTFDYRISPLTPRERDLCGTPFDPQPYVQLVEGRIL